MDKVVVCVCVSVCHCPSVYVFVCEGMPAASMEQVRRKTPQERWGEEGGLALPSNLSLLNRQVQKKEEGGEREERDSRSLMSEKGHSVSSAGS